MPPPPIQTHNGSTMKHLGTISYVITLSGVLLIVTSSIAGLSQLWMLVGLLLAIAGAVKIAVVQIWRRIAEL